MEEQREGRWEGFCLDMEAQEADREMHLGLKSEAVTHLLGLTLFWSRQQFNSES